eukprot:1139471-Pelagomonas_calceolata.AAC.2
MAAHEEIIHLSRELFVFAVHEKLVSFKVHSQQPKHGTQAVRNEQRGTKVQFHMRICLKALF